MYPSEAAHPNSMKNSMKHSMKHSMKNSLKHSLKHSLKNSEAESEEYCIRICVYADGTFAASGPEPLPEDQTAETEPVTSIHEALNAAFTLFTSHPVGGDEQAQFEAGLKEASGGSPYA